MLRGQSIQSNPEIPKQMQKPHVTVNMMSDPLETVACKVILLMKMYGVAFGLATFNLVIENLLRNYLQGQLNPFSSF
jgi:hypothetical protein